MTDCGAQGTTGRVGGVDGAAGGWVMAITGARNGSPVEFSVWVSFAELWAEARRQSLAAVGIDMPIGLPSSSQRLADEQAREMLGPRRSSLFWSPPEAALSASDFDAANQASRGHLGKGVSKQAFNLLPRIREVRSVLAPAEFEASAAPRAAEVHPELSFAVMAAVLHANVGPDRIGEPTSSDGEPTPSRPMTHPKRIQAGIAERLALLGSCFTGITESAVLSPLAGPPHPALDDLLDAAAAAWTARRIAAGDAEHLGAVDGHIPLDNLGYPLTIVV